MFKKSIITNQVFWLALPIFFVFILILIAFSRFFYQYQLSYFYDELSLYRDLVEVRIQDEVERKEAVCALLKQGLESASFKQSPKVEEIEGALDPYWCLIKKIPLLIKNFSFTFILTSQKQFFMASKGEDAFCFREDEFLKSLVCPEAFNGFSYLNKNSFYLTQPFEYRNKDGRLGMHVLFIKALFEEKTGRFLGFYGSAICLNEWADYLFKSMSNMKAVVICDEKGKIFLRRFSSQKQVFGSFKYLQEEAFLEAVMKLNAKGFMQSSTSLLKVGKLDLAFMPILVDSPTQSFYIFLGFSCFTYWTFIQELFLPLVLFSFVVFFLIFVLIYLFMEIFIWRPLHALAVHIINISSTNNFTLPLPNIVLAGEINYLFMQFKYLQERLAGLLLEMKNLYQQSLLMQDTIFEKNSRVYFDSQEAIEHCVNLDSDNVFLNQFLNKFKERFIDLFELSEKAIVLLGKIIKRKENFISSWFLINQIVENLSPNMPHDQLSLQISRIKQWTSENSVSNLKLNTKELENLQQLFVDFNASRLDLISSFFEMRKSLNFLMDNTRDTTAFLQRMGREVEGLFLVQSQDLQRNRERIRSLIKNIH